jgi:hypothetical protein
MNVNAASDDSDENPEGPGDAAQLSYEERVQHFTAGYDNSQSIARFLDAKASAVIGIIPVVLGLSIGVLNWLGPLLGYQDYKDVIGMGLPIFIWPLCVATFAWLGFEAFTAVRSAFNAISPRVKIAPPSVLFPYRYEGEDADDTIEERDTSYRSRVRYFTRDAKQSDAIEDHRRQLVQMSMIVRAKIDDVKSAVTHLKRTLLAASVFVGLLLVYSGVVALAREFAC